MQKEKLCLFDEKYSSNIKGIYKRLHVIFFIFWGRKSLEMA
jgi:hypothetical protein